MTLKKLLMLTVYILFFILPIKWIGKTTGLGCLMGSPGFGYTLGNVWCYLWNLFRGLFLWPFIDIWTEVGMQQIMTTYTLIGLGIVLIVLISKFIKTKI